ncbi:MAG: hypothetical protein AB202_02035 [Parcubacteria bacterium C7867-007]|nr:MAG: hypothetical protein AB202_02035 [Parcubacteria bacterium C7867-007]
MRIRRRLAGFSQQQVGAKCGVTFQTVQKMESGQVDISIKRLWKLSEVLGVPITYFFDGYGETDDGSPVTSS